MVLETYKVNKIFGFYSKIVDETNCVSFKLDLIKFLL